jgi:RHS repeat-associated protein
MRIYGTQAGTYYFLNDHLGTPRIIIDESGQIVWQAAYLPFGKAQVTTETVENHFRLPGQYFDEESGLHYYWHRYYDPKTGRYLTPDPIGLEGGINLFVYVQNDPVNFVDPDGLIFGSVASKILGPLLGKTSQEAAVAGMMSDGAISLALEASDNSVALPGVLGYASDALQIHGGYQLGLLGTTIAAQGAAGVALPAILSGGGGVLIGLGINHLYDRISGQSLGADIYDWTHPEKTTGKPCK